MNFSSELTNIEGYTLILPAVSIGNVGQLGVDILLATLKPEKMADVWHSAILPVVGSNPLDENSQELMTACQVFKHDAQRLVVLQIRSGLAKGKKDKFLKDLMTWCTGSKLAEIIMLASSSADERLDEQIVGPPLRYLCNGDKELFKTLGMKELELRERFPGIQANKDLSATDSLFIPGGGFAKALYLKCLEENYPMTVLLIFCSEGDNTRDAFQLIEYLNHWKKWIPMSESTPMGKSVKISVPGSWKHLFGNPVPNSMY